MRIIYEYVLKPAMSSFSTDLLMNVSEKKGYVKVSYCMIKVLLIRNDPVFKIAEINFYFRLSNSTR